MSTLTSNATNTSALGWVLAPFRAIVKGMEHLTEANSRVSQVTALQNLSDAELAEIGIQSRDDIVRFVFSDRMGI